MCSWTVRPTHSVSTLEEGFPWHLFAHILKYVHWLFLHFRSERVTMDARGPSSVNSPPYLCIPAHTSTNRIVQSPGNTNKPHQVSSWFYNTLSCLHHDTVTLIIKLTINLVLAFPKRITTLKILFKRNFQHYTLTQAITYPFLFIIII